MPSSALQEVRRDDVVRLRPARRPGQGGGARRPVVLRAPEGRLDRGRVVVVPADGPIMSSGVGMAVVVLHHVGAPGGGASGAATGRVRLGT